MSHATKTTCHTLVMDTILLFRKPSFRHLLASVSILATLSSALHIGVGRVTASGVWDQAVPINVPYAQAASKYVEFYSIDCASVGNCTAVGKYWNDSYRMIAITATSTAGVWESASAVNPVSPVLRHASPDESLVSVSCASAGNCVAVGRFKNALGDYEAFSVTSSSGVWGAVTPAVFAPNTQYSSPNDEFTAVECASVGNCVAVGRFRDTQNQWQAFTRTMSNGVWEVAIPVEFPSNTQYLAPADWLRAISCASVGNCTAVGSFGDSTGFERQAFTVTMSNGVWGDAIPAEFLSTQYSSPDAEFSAVSCPSVGHCVAVGRFKNFAGASETFTMTMSNGTWGRAVAAVFPPNTQNDGPGDYFNAVSCASAGNCTAVGSFVNRVGSAQGFTMTMSNGAWGLATPIVYPSNMQYANQFAQLTSVSCASAGNCTAVGQTTLINNKYPAIMVSSSNGVWGEIQAVPFGLNTQDTSEEGWLRAVSCPTVGNCSAVGTFYDATLTASYPGFAVSSSYTAPPPTPTTPNAGGGTTTTVANAPTGSPTTTVAPRLLPATGSDITIGWLLTGMVCVLGGAVAVRLRHRLR